jgi:hypothetical protein
VQQVLQQRADRGRLPSHTPKASVWSLISMLNSGAGRALRPLLRQFEVPTREELRGLSRRIGRLERRLRSQRVTAAAEPGPAENARSSRAQDRRTCRCGVCGALLGTSDLGTHACGGADGWKPGEYATLFWDEA